MEKMLKISLAEITVLRVICKDCQTTMDIPLARLANAPLTCPACRKELGRPNTLNALSTLSNAFSKLQKHDDIDIQFVIPCDPD